MVGCKQLFDYQDRIAVCIVLTWITTFPQGTAAQEHSRQVPQDDPQQFIREVVSNELSAEQRDSSLWSFKQVNRSGSNTEEFEVVETSKGTIEKLLARNGRGLPAQDSIRENERVHEFASDPEKFNSHAKKEKEDAAEATRFLRMLPDAFQYRYAGHDQSLVEFDFKPNGSFKPRTREGSIFHNIQGKVWIDSTQRRIAGLQGTLMNEVRFGGGVLGHLNKGGTFDMRRRDVGQGHWEITRLVVHMNGKALFFKTIRVNHDEQNSDFKPLKSDMTLQQAAEFLDSVQLNR